jgi:hypothetical protein
VLQICFSGSDDPSGGGAFVVPTLAQERYMAYDAILNGARGLFFYGGHIPSCFTAEDAARGWNWTFWYVVLAPLLREIGPGSPLGAALLAPPARTRAATADPTTQLTTRRVGDEVWVIAARHGSGSRRVALTHLPSSARTARVYREGRRVSIRLGVIVDRFAQYYVHVYRIRVPG